MLRLFFSFLVVMIVSLGLRAQSLNDIQNLRVDNLSNSQLEELIRRYESQGLTQDQMLNYASERGMAAGEIAKLRTRLNSFQSPKATETNQSKVTESSRKVQDGKLKDQIFDSLRRADPYYDLTPYQKKIFGYKLFHNKDLNFNPELNIPTPSSYVLGRGDQLLIEIYGASQQSYSLIVNPDGKIFVPNVGPIQVGGITVSAATSKVRNALSKIYSGLTSSSSNTFMELTLGNIKTVKVALVGEINHPGNYTLPSFASPFHALFAAGGPNENGSFRYIQVYRNNKLLSEVDIYDFLTKGVFSTSVMLQDDDVVIVPPARSRIEIEGAVRREGVFELKSGETFADLLSFTGGFNSQAFQDRVSVTRKTGSEFRVEDIESNQYSDFVPRDGDLFRVGEILNRFENRIQITGALNRPGVFALEEGMTIKDLIQKAGGLRNDAFVKRAALYRTKEDFSLEIVAVDIQEVLNGNLEDVLLNREDVLNIPSIYELREEYYVKISGEVNRPGAYQFGANFTIEDLVIKAGGFKESATSSRVEIARRIKDDLSGKLAEIIIVDIDKDLKIASDKRNLFLQPFDHVIIRKSPGFQREKLVKVEGEALYPGEFAIAHTNERISDIIKRAGGLNPYAYPKGATLIRRNEFYKEPLEDEIIINTLNNVKSNINRDSLDWTESDKIFYSRVNQKITQSSKNLPMQQNTLSSEDFRQESISDLGEKANPKGNYTIRDTELIGINLATILISPYGPDDLILKEGDVLSIPRELQTVRMRGEVLYPTSTRYKPYLGFKDYISQAGGFTEKARRGRSFVIYANGDVRRTKKIFFVNFFPNIEPGAELIVPEKPEKAPLTAQGWIGLGTSLATLAIIVNNLIK